VGDGYSFTVDISANRFLLCLPKSVSSPSLNLNTGKLYHSFFFVYVIMFSYRVRSKVSRTVSLSFFGELFI
jgi:hypothetical protein